MALAWIRSWTRPMWAYAGNLSPGAASLDWAPLGHTGPLLPAGALRSCIGTRAFAFWLGMGRQSPPLSADPPGLQSQMHAHLHKFHDSSGLRREHHARGLIESADRILQRTISAVDRANRLIEALLIYSLTRSGGQSIGVVQFNALINSTRDDLEALSPASGVDIEVAPRPDIEDNRCQRVQQRLNLIVNTLRFGPACITSNIHIRGEYFERPEDVRARRCCHLVVQDHDIGADNELPARILAPNMRLTDNRRNQGACLGLGVVRRAKTHARWRNAQPRRRWKGHLLCHRSASSATCPLSPLRQPTSAQIEPR